MSSSFSLEYGRGKRDCDVGSAGVSGHRRQGLFFIFLHSTLDKSQSECILTASLVSYVGEIGRQDHGSSDRTELCVCDLSAFEHENSPVERDPDHFAAWLKETDATSEGINCHESDC